MSAEYNFRFRIDWNVPRFNLDLTAGYIGQVKVLGYPVVGSPTQAQINAAVAAYIEEHPGVLSPLSPAVKAALLQIAEKVAYIDANGQSYYNALDAALNAKALLSITAVYTQSGTVYDTDSLDSLKDDLVVTAYYDDGTLADVTSASTLSGTLTEGTSTVTVTYQEKTATFNVTVDSALPEGYTLYDYVTADGTQYIQTQLTDAQVVNWGYECKESAVPTAQGNGHMLSSTNVYYPYLARGSSASDTWVGGKRYGNETQTRVSGSTSYVAGSVYTIKAYLNGTDDVFMYDSDGNETMHTTFAKGSTGLTSSNKLAFFTYGGGVTQLKYRFRGDFYYLKLTDASGNLVHYYLPCKNSSNVVGLYDVVAGSFLSPAGTLTGKERG